MIFCLIFFVQILCLNTAINDSLSALQTDWIDLYLVHHPHCDKQLCSGSWKTSWRIMEDYYFQNKLKYVGISNFGLNEFHELLDWTRIPIAVVQNWFDPFHTSDNNIIQECQAMGIVFQAYSLLGGQHTNGNPVFSNRKLRQIAKKYSKKIGDDGKISVAQIVLRWALQKGLGVLPRSSKAAHIEQNINVFDFELSEKDMNAINELVTN